MLKYEYKFSAFGKVRNKKIGKKAPSKTPYIRKEIKNVQQWRN